MKNYIISIDGHSGCGKSTLAKKLALELRYTYVDTGAMYRAVALFALQNGLIDEKGKLKADAINEVEKLVIDFTEPNEQGESYIQLNGLVVEKEIRSIEVSDRMMKNLCILGFFTRLHYFSSLTNNINIVKLFYLT